MSNKDLISYLSEHDLSLPYELEKTDEKSIFEYKDVSSENVFPQSISSGGPTPNGVILWTRINPDFYDPEEPMGLQIASDSDFNEIIYRGIIKDNEAIKKHDYTIKIDLDGILEPNNFYYYRFIYNNVKSRHGRCKTLPSSNSSPEKISQYNAGLYFWWFEFHIYIFKFFCSFFYSLFFR